MDEKPIIESHEACRAEIDALRRVAKRGERIETVVRQVLLGCSFCATGNVDCTPGHERLKESLRDGM